jgi:predicted transcriptional regulator
MDFIPRLWAFRMIRELQDQILVQGETEDLKQDIIDLALEYSFITPYTSFILVIKEPDQQKEADIDPLEGEGSDLAGVSQDGDGDGVENNMDPSQGWDIGVYDNSAPRVPGDDDDDRESDWDDDTDDSTGDILPMEDQGVTGAPFFIFIFVMIAVVVLILVLLIFGYSRIRKEHLLEQENRKKIYEHIRDNPEIHFRGLQRAVELEVGVLSHHLNVLEKEQLIISEQDGNNRRFWCAGVKHDDNKVRLSRIQENILKSIEDDPGITQSQIAKEIGVSRKVVFYHVKFLSKAGVVREEKEKRLTHYYSRE